MKTLLREAEHYDLIVIGASQEKLFQRIVMGRLPEEFAHRCQKPLVMIKASSPVKSMLGRRV
ncbi:MAG: universal stress protein [Candidatus Aerophobetes bacterium]